MSGITNINIQPSVVINICEHNAGTPHAVLNDARAGSNIFKFKIALIKIDFIISHIGSKENIRESVVIQIAGCYATPIVKISKQKTVLQFTINYLIIEIDARVFDQFK